MGSDEGENDERPVHIVYLDSFYIDKTEVSNAQFAQFLNEQGNQEENGVTWLDIEDREGTITESGGRYQPKGGYAHHPVTEVTWYGAVAYCEWAGRRLPTEAEWEKAARGTDARTYPWGEGIDCNHANYSACIGETTEVGSYPLGASPYGALDMAGNVWEWVSDWAYDHYYAASPGSNPQGPDSGSSRMVRGGSLHNADRRVRAAVRFSNDPFNSLSSMGFRCASSMPPTVATSPPTAPADSDQGFLLEDIGFSTPESVLYDPEGDLYLVANINGNPAAKDWNGFISRISPQGGLLVLKWIDGKAADVTLNAPKGMALSGNRLYVADIDVLRVFDRETGAPLGEIEIPGASFLNDVAAAEDGTIYITDSNIGAVYRLPPDGSAEQVVEAGQINGPNGIQVRGETVLVATGGGQIYRLGDDGALSLEFEVPASGLDGLILLDDGGGLVSSWGGSAVYRFDGERQVSELFGGIDAPADIGFDKKRGYVLIPHLQHNRVEARPLP